MRKHYIDNLRCGTIVLVILYHIVYNFNNLGIISNVTVKGTPEFDLFLYVQYPWFMALLFLLAGMSARYALSKNGGKGFLKSRVRKILIPSLAGIFIIGWSGGLVTNYYVDMFAGNGDMIPGVIKFLIYCLSGIGPLWFLHELFLCTLILLLIRKIDKKDSLWKVGGKLSKIWLLALLVVPVWISSLCFNTPVIEVYRNGFYLTFFLIGYYVFSHEEVQEEVKKWWLPLLVVGVGLCIGYTVYFWGENFATLPNLKHPLTNAFAWFGCLAMMALGKRFLDKETGFTRFMRGRSFGYFVLHNYLIVIITCVIDMKFELRFPLFYLILTILLAAVMLPLYEVLSRIPVIRRLLFGK